MSVRDSLAPALREHIARLAQEVRDRRAALGLNLRDAAAEIGVPFNTLSRLEHGQTPELLNYYAISEWAGYPTELPPLDESTGCCAKDGVDCVMCMTGRCSDCSECVHYDDSARDEDDYREDEG